MSEEYGLRCCDSQISSFHKSSEDTHTSPEGGHAVDKGTATTFFFFTLERKKEEQVRNCVLILSWQKGT